MSRPMIASFTIILTLVIVSMQAFYVYSDVTRASINVTVKVGDWEITVVSMTQATYIKSDDDYYSVAQGFKIVLITLRLTNLGSKTSYIPGIYSFVLVTDAGKSYNRAYTYELTLVWLVTEDVINNAVTYDALNLFANVAPGTSVEGDIMFQILVTETPTRLHFTVDMFEPVEVVVYLQPPYTFTIIGETATSPSTPLITTAIIVRESATVTTTVTQTTTVITTATSTIEKLTTVTSKETITVTATDWTSAATLAVMLFVIGIAIGYIAKRS